MDELHQAVRSVLAALGMADVGGDELNDLTLCIGHTGKLLEATTSLIMSLISLLSNYIK
jgi:hypothetical protein